MNAPRDDRANGNSRKATAWIIGTVFVLLIGLLLYGVLVSDRAGRDALPSPLIGRAAPEFSLPVLHEPGRLVSSQELRGEPYLLNVWGSWCPGCRVEHGTIARFAETRRVRVIGYNWKDEHADAIRWLEHFGNPYWLVLVDYDGRKAIDWGIYGAPETFLVDGDGIVRWKHVGPIDDDIVASQLDPLLDAMGVPK
jgi:cytochrome c biogenesis protein CcmG, thiol:disulfide interchange protein DsbE